MGFIKILLLIVLLVGAAYGGFVYGQMTLQKDGVEVEIPIKQDVNVPLDQKISLPIETSIEVPINKTIYIKKEVPISTSVLIDTVVKVPMNVSGIMVYVDVPIKKEIPISTIFSINEPINIAEKILFPISQNFEIELKKDVLIPIDTVIKTKVPLPWSTG